MSSVIDTSFISHFDNTSSIIVESLHVDDSGSQVLASARGIRILLEARAAALPPDPKDDNAKQTHIRLLSRATRERDDDHFGEIIKKTLGRFLTPDGEWISREAALATHRLVPCDLAALLFPPIRYFRITLNQSNELSMEPIDAADSEAKVDIKEAHPGAHDLGFTIDPSLKLYSTEDVVVLENLGRSQGSGHITCRVSVNGQEMFCKAERGGIAFGDSGVGYDFKRMLNIRRGLAGQPELSLHVPKLLGYLRHPEEGHVVGFLREWIPGWNLTSRPIDRVPQETLLSWDDKIADTVNQLHAMDAIWGGGGPDSIVIDDHGEPWLIDFSSGVARGWRDEDSHDPEGDWFGVDLVSRYLGLIEDSDEDEELGCTGNVSE